MAILPVCEPKVKVSSERYAFSSPAESWIPTVWKMLRKLVINLAQWIPNKFMRAEHLVLPSRHRLACKQIVHANYLWTEIHRMCRVLDIQNGVVQRGWCIKQYDWAEPYRTNDCPVCYWCSGSRIYCNKNADEITPPADRTSRSIWQIFKMFNERQKPDIKEDNKETV